MNSIRPTNRLGTSLEVDIGAVEKELASFWKSAGEAGEGAVMRACSSNLLAFVRGRKEAEDFPPVLARVSEWHPNRAIIACVEPDETLGPPDIHAWISAQCSIPLSGGPQVCSEAITVLARSRARQSLPDTLVALLIPDLPVYLYWRSFRMTDRDLIERMSVFSHLLIVDSHQCQEDPESRLHILQFLVHQSARMAVRDLNWGRITPWRDLVAQFFDSPATSHYVREISEIEITRNLAAPGSIPTRTLLLTGWLASSLGWQRISAERSEDTWLSNWKSGDGEVRVRFTGTVSNTGRPPGISSVTLRTRDGSEFSVFVEQGSRCLGAVALMDGSRLVHSVPEESQDEASLLISELSQTGEDAAFEAALAEAYELEKAFRYGNIAS